MNSQNDTHDQSRDYRNVDDMLRLESASCGTNTRELLRRILEQIPASGSFESARLAKSVAEIVTQLDASSENRNETSKPTRQPYQEEVDVSGSPEVLKALEVLAKRNGLA